MTDTQQKLQKAGIITSFVIGLLPGLLAIVFLYNGLAVVYTKAVLALAVAFLYGLWYAGKRMVKNLQDGDTLLQASFMYSLRVNAIIWSVFFLVSVVTNFSVASLVMILPSVTAFLLCLTFTTLSLGLLIAWLVNRSMKKIDPVSFDDKVIGRY